ILSHAQDPGKNRYLTAWQSKCIDLLRLNDLGFPLEPVALQVQVDLALQRSDSGGADDPGGDLAGAFDLVPLGRQDLSPIFTEDLCIGAPTKLQFLLSRQSEGLGSVARPLRVGQLAARSSQAAQHERQAPKQPAPWNASLDRCR